MDWNEIKYFNEKEFFGQANLLDPQVIKNLDTYRQTIQEKIFISPARGAIARFSGSTTSQHYVGPHPNKVIRKATAIDFFAEGIPFINFSHLYHSGLFSGIGIYLDTRGIDGKPWVMFHGDLRTSYNVCNPLVWICIKDIHPKKDSLVNSYKYPDRDSQHWHLLQRSIFFQERYAV